MPELSAGRKMVEGFRYVKDVYCNCASMLLSCDPTLGDRGLIPYKWSAVYGWNEKITEPSTWLPESVIRQYHPTDKKDREIVTVGAIPWRRRNSEAFEAICVATRMEVTGTPDEVYWLGVLPMHQDNVQSDGVVRIFDQNQDWLENSKKQEFSSIVRGSIIGIAVPLFDISNRDQLFRLIIDPLLSHPWPLPVDCPVQGPQSKR